MVLQKDYLVKVKNKKVMTRIKDKEFLSNNGMVFRTRQLFNEMLRFGELVSTDYSVGIDIVTLTVKVKLSKRLTDKA